MTYIHTLWIYKYNNDTTDILNMIFIYIYISLVWCGLVLFSFNISWFLAALHLELAYISYIGI